MQYAHILPITFVIYAQKCQCMLCIAHMYALPLVTGRWRLCYQCVVCCTLWIYAISTVYRVLKRSSSCPAVYLSKMLGLWHSHSALNLIKKNGIHFLINTLIHSKKQRSHDCTMFGCLKCHFMLRQCCSQAFMS